MSTMKPEICQMPAAEYHGLERRQAALETSFAEQSQIVTKLLTLSENNISAMNRLETWVATHEADYRTVRERLLTQEVRQDAASKRIETLTAAVEAAMNAYLAGKHKLSGGWFVVTTTAATVLGLLTVAKALGLI